MDRAATIRDGRVSAEGRGGAEYAVVGPTGSLRSPAHALDVQFLPGAWSRSRSTATRWC